MGPIDTYEDLLDFLAKTPIRLDASIVDEPVTWHRSPNGRTAHLGEHCPARRRTWITFHAPLRNPGAAVCPACFGMSKTRVTEYLYRVRDFHSCLTSAQAQLSAARTGTVRQRVGALTRAATHIRYAGNYAGLFDEVTAQHVRRAVAATHAKIEARRSKLSSAEDKLIHELLLASPGVYSDARLIGDDTMNTGLRYEIDSALRRAHVRASSHAEALREIRKLLEGCGLPPSEARTTGVRWLASADAKLAAVTAERSPTVMYLRRSSAWKQDDWPPMVWWFYTGRTLPDAFAQVPKTVADALHRFTASHVEARPSVIVVGAAEASDTPEIYAAASGLVRDGYEPADALMAARLLD